MITWLRNLLFGNGDIYTPKDMQIYTLFDGQKMVSVDPMILSKRLASVRGEMSINVKVAKSTLLSDEEVIKGDDLFLKNIRHIFSVKPFAEGGLTETATIELLDHFMTWKERLKKNSNPSPILPTETLPLSEPASAAAPATSNISDSGSTKSEPSIVEQGPSLSAAGSLTATS